MKQIKSKKLTKHTMKSSKQIFVIETIDFWNCLSLSTNVDPRHPTHVVIIQFHKTVHLISRRWRPTTTAIFLHLETLSTHLSIFVFIAFSAPNSLSFFFYFFFCSNYFIFGDNNATINNWISFFHIFSIKTQILKKKFSKNEWKYRLAVCKWKIWAK